MRKKKTMQPLTTPYNPGEIPHGDYYPRPLLKRENYTCLNGVWQLTLIEKRKSTPLGNILVPFPPESKASGIERITKKNETLLYERSFSYQKKNSRTILHFGAVDNEMTVLLNGQAIGGHIGGYLPFSFDVSSAIKEGENQIEVYVSDATSRNYPYGKQRHRRGGMWYTPTSGIWQTVWLEDVPEEYIESIKITPTLDSVTIETVGGAEEKTVYLGEKSYTYTGDSVTLTVENPCHWTPETPHLYDFRLEAGEDKISSYFALREMRMQTVNGQSYMCLNGKPYFFHGLLDQGYFADGIYLPSSKQGYEDDILAMKGLGFNMLRKHIKIEPAIFYYLCDKLGMAVFQDMVNNGRYDYIVDTVLPTIGIRRGLSHTVSPVRQSIFFAHAVETAELLYSYPSVVYYTIYNEGWGQPPVVASRHYRALKAQDPTRVWDTASGWFKNVESDVTSEHIYFRPAMFEKTPHKPMVLSEFGGYCYKILEHSFNLDKTYGYRQCPDKESFTADLEALYTKEILPMIRKGLGATVLTQVSDVEDETNGLVTYDRQLVKPDKERMLGIAKALFEAFEETVK